MIQVSEEFLGRFFGKPPGDITDALKEGDDYKSQDEVESYLSKQLKGKLNSAKAEGKKESYGRAKREVLSDLEKKKAEEYDIQDYSDIDDIFEKVQSKAIADVESDDEGMSESEIKNTDVFQEAVKAEIKKREEVQNEFDEFKSKVNTSKKHRKLKSDLAGILPDEFNLPETEKVRSNQIEAFVSHLTSEVDFQYNEDGTAVVDEEGNVIKDDNLNPKDYEDFILDSAGKFFEKKKGDDRNSPSPKKKDKGSGSKGKMPEMSSFSDFKKELKKVDTNEERNALKDSFKKQQEEAES